MNARSALVHGLSFLTVCLLLPCDIVMAATQMFYYDGADTLRTEGNSFLDASTSSKNYMKGKAVLLDSVLLSKGDVLLGSNSAVSEFAVYFNPKLASNSFNLQFGMPAWLAKEQVVFKNETLLLSYKPPTGPECGVGGEEEEEKKEGK